MAAASRSNVSAIFELKSAALTLIAVVLKTTDLDALARELTQRFGDTPGMFEQDPVVIDLTQVRNDAAPIDFSALATLLRAQRMVPVAVKGGSVDQMAAALDAGFAEAPEGVAPRASSVPPVPPNTEPPAAPPPATPAEPPIEEPPAPAPPPIEEPPSGRPPLQAEPEVRPPSSYATMVVDRPLRSGQQVYARNADLVVMAGVSVGAEVIADGHIHVYGPLRGRAIAGAKGNVDARIFTTCMEPQLISIAGTYRTTETALPADVWARPAQVRLDGDRLVVEPLTT